MTRLQGRRASIHARLATHLQTSRLRIVVKSADPKASAQPLILSGDSAQWVERGMWKEGTSVVDLPTSGTHLCRILYAGAIQGQCELSDPSSLPNIRRMLLGIVDPDLKRLKDLLLQPTDKRRDDFEAAVALLFQMLGFAPAHIGAMSGWTDEPDILVTSPTGDVLLLECTTRVPDDQKISLLVSRTIRMRNMAGASSHNASKLGAITAALVTPRPAEELTPVREKAEVNDILVVCQAELSDLIARTELYPDPQAILSYLREIPLRRLMTGGYRD